ncbi:hypothetical protein [Salsuginibacillus kocurii]|uniref:hypothetical protein n=1 Tax=Salsuginibacillus kocurii TaxID=427078 RepID=UPI000360314E|nr:hypothetical protein [Salsuginibacillus kocurii]
MVELLLDFMLGPLRVISQFYVEYQMIFNPIIVGFALYKIIQGRKKEQRSEEETVS